MLRGRNKLEPEYRRRARKKAENKQREAERERRHRENRNAIDGIVSEIGAIKAQTQTNEHEHNRQWHRERCWQLGEIMALVAAAVVGLIAIIVGNSDAERQRNAMGDQLLEMQAEQRPWVKQSATVASDLVFGAQEGSGVGIVPSDKIIPMSDIALQQYYFGYGESAD